MPLPKPTTNEGGGDSNVANNAAQSGPVPFELEVHRQVATMTDNNPSFSSVPDVTTCRIKFCKKLDSKSHPMMKCSHEGCDKLVHKECYESYILQKHKDLQNISAGIVFCTKVCHQTHLKNQEGWFGWETDGTDG